MNTLDRSTLEELVKKEQIKPRLRRELRFVPEEVTDWEDRDFLAVMNRSRSVGVLIAPLDRLYVASFSLQKRTANRAGRVEAVICDICATWRRGTESSMITFQGSGSSRTFLCCEDLLCSFHVRGKTAAAKLSRVQLRETNNTAGRIVRLRARLGTILQEIDKA